MVSEQVTEPPEENVREHVEDVADGCGCTEVWEHLGARPSGEGSSDD